MSSQIKMPFDKVLIVINSTVTQVFQTSYNNF